MTKALPSVFNGFVFGIIVGGLVLAVEILKSSPYEFHNTSKLVYISVLLAFGAIGAIWGERIMEKILGWLTWIS